MDDLSTAWKKYEEELKTRRVKQYNDMLLTLIILTIIFLLIAVFVRR